MTDPHAAITDLALRQALIKAYRELLQRGLSYGTSGNISVRRDEQRFFITPSGMLADALTPDDVPLLDIDGRWFGHRQPSSEWRFHRDIFRSRDEVRAIVHTHSPHATSLACTGRGIPAFHYMVARAGGPDIRCAPYRTFGTQELSDVAVAALQGRSACLLANHGVIATGANLADALALAGEIENLALQYCTTLMIGEVRTLSEREMSQVVEKFRTYGTQDAPDSGLVFGGNDIQC